MPTRAMSGIDWSLLAKAVALAFVIEGVAMFSAPTISRAAARQLMECNDGQLRIIGFGSAALGLLLLFIVPN